MTDNRDGQTSQCDMISCSLQQQGDQKKKKKNFRPSATKSGQPCGVTSALLLLCRIPPGWLGRGGLALYTLSHDYVTVGGARPLRWVSVYLVLFSVREWCIYKEKKRLKAPKIIPKMKRWRRDWTAARKEPTCLLDVWEQPSCSRVYLVLILWQTEQLSCSTGWVETNLQMTEDRKQSSPIHFHGFFWKLMKEKKCKSWMSIIFDFTKRNKRNKKRKKTRKRRKCLFLVCQKFHRCAVLWQSFSQT